MSCRGRAEPSFQQLPNLESERTVTTSNVVSPADHKASLPTRQAIQHQLRCQPSDPDAPAADKQQQVARSLVDNAMQDKVPAIREVLDRSDGKTLPGVPESADPHEHPMA